MIINETRSILENLVEIEIKVPSFLIKGLDVYSKIIENKSEILTSTVKEENK